MKLAIPDLSLVVLIGPSGAGKSTFARRHFRPTEVISSDTCRGMVSDDENDLDVSEEAFSLVRFIAGQRLGLGKLTVIDATSVDQASRAPLVALARQFHCLPVAIVLNLPAKVCQARNRERADRQFGAHVVRSQRLRVKQSLRGLQREGFRHVYVLDSEEAVDAAVVERQPLWNNRRHDHGPFDVIGDVHGCFDELAGLLALLGYAIECDEGDTEPAYRVTHPEGRRVVFLGDLVDRGPKIVDTLRLAMDMVASGVALCVPGNHETKLLKKLRGKDVKVNHGLAETLSQLEAAGEGFARRAATFIDGLVSHYVFDDGKLVTAHAGLKESMQGRGSGGVREFALYGETTGETDSYGLPVRFNWAAEYRGRATVVYGHTPVPEPEWLNNTICVDTGCVYGGSLTALRYPERATVSFAALREYCAPVRPLAAARPERSAQHASDDVLDMADVAGKRVLHTRLMKTLTVRAENAAAALEAMSRFAVAPQWLIYLPPTMSPSETSAVAGMLEHPNEAFEYFAREGVARVVCEEKHMGSRAVVIVCRSAEAAARRFGVTTGEAGLCYTRTGRRFFDDGALEAALLERVRTAMDTAGLWEELATDWVCLDCELMPWSAKAQELIRQQYAAVGSASRAALGESVAVLETALAAGREVGELLERFRTRAALADRYVESYQRYCWAVNGIDDYRLAPFHVMATEGAVHVDQDHLWHLGTIARLCEAGEGELLFATAHRVIELGDEASRAEGVAWWEALTAGGGEGMVVKPIDFVAKGKKGLVQPALKSRGREYLRIIYGAEYTLPGNLERLRERAVAGKRALALREFALGVEGLERFVAREPLRRVHECVFGVLALESEAIDPRL
ncbi:MAG: polynucleotide kinasephosphatase [Myxococcaceae bacterium]|nr:polynucleotide kinasephosphatase [Myxococcaceae bacterium]